MLDKGGSWGDSSVGIQVLFQLEAPAKKKKKIQKRHPPTCCVLTGVSWACRTIAKN